MKKVVPTLLLTIAVLFGKAQTPSIWFNELVPDPGPNEDEYIEFYNTSTTPISLDCYFVVSYFETNQEKGIYIYNFPSNATIKGLSHYTISSDNPVRYKSNDNDLSYTPTDPSSFNNWNAIGSGGYISKYTYDNSKKGSGTNAWSTAQPVGGDFNNFIRIANGMDAVLLLYKINSDGSTQYVNGFIANPGSDVTTMLTAVESLGSLPINADGSCVSNTTPVLLDFNGLPSRNFDVITIQEATGRGQGYAKKNDGLCGNWEKIQKGEFSPGEKNNFGTTNSSITTIESYACNTVSFSISTTGSTSYPMRVLLFYDNPATGVFDAKDDSINYKLVESAATASNTFNIPNYNQAVILAYKSSAGCFDKIAPLTSSCSVLPVHFRSFTANRNKQKREEVALKWETASEQNNRGFNVQRKISGEWKNIAFIKSKASNGNSATTLSYEYTDINTIGSAIQYRIQQVDWDGKVSFSDVRTVINTEENRSIIVYPNPGIDGKVNVLFKELNAAKQVIVYDTNGRLVQQFPQVRDIKLTIEGLPIGFYTIKVIDRSNLITSVQKVIIQ